MKPARASAWSLSVFLHAIALLVVGAFWIVSVPEEEIVVTVASLRRPEPRPWFSEREAQEHLPIVPRVFQDDPEIVNDASEVVVNSVPTEIDGAIHAGDSPTAASDPLRGSSISGAIGLAGGAGTRGAYASRFG